MIKLIFGLFLLISSFSLSADTHSITPTINYSVEQESAPGYGLNYQYKFKESIELDIGFQDSNTLTINFNDGEIEGKYQSYLLGANLIKSYNNELSFKIGSGASYVINSDNATLVKNNAISPYLKIALDYKLSDNISIEIGQISQFHKGHLDSNHQLTLGLRWDFYDNQSKSSIKTVRSVPKEVPASSQQSLLTNKPFTQAAVPDSLLSSDTSLEIPIQASPAWYIQLGAFSSQQAAQSALINLNEAVENNISIKIILHDNLYRLLSSNHTSKSPAKTKLQHLRSQYDIDGFLTHLTLP